MRNKTNCSGFTLIELLVVLAIIAILAAIVFLLTNPQQIVKESRDSIRLNDLTDLEKAIYIALQDNTGNPATILCYNLTRPCEGSSNDIGYDVRASDGTGWLKVNLRAASYISVLTLDPLNNPNFFYIYRTNNAGSKWEINAILESNKYSIKMPNDQGSNPGRYEIGSDLSIIP